MALGNSTGTGTNGVTAEVIEVQSIDELKELDAQIANLTEKYDVQTVHFFPSRKESNSSNEKMNNSNKKITKPMKCQKKSDNKIKT